MDRASKLLQDIGTQKILPKWKLLGVTDDVYGRRDFIFFAADTIWREPPYLDVVIAKLPLPLDGDSNEEVISRMQRGGYAASLMISRIDCKTEEIAGIDVTGAKTFELSLVAYLCARH